MAPLMRVMGRDAGRGVLRRMVEDALNKGMTPVRDAETALQAGRHSEVARILHGLRGSVGTLGTKRLIRAAFATEEAIDAGRHDEVPALLSGAGRSWNWRWPRRANGCPGWRIRPAT
jgi:hypothetical protein